MEINGSSSHIIEKPLSANGRTHTERKKKPEWLRVKLPIGKEYVKLRQIVSDHKHCANLMCNHSCLPTVQVTNIRKNSKTVAVALLAL